ncbi:toxin-activating lysine-acyltransferase [Asticcacaulis solisilvae]|uniref:toxin-activating lysine-acyltransferase n=1 Tax=Asticcacaulis solisilvae TaxID=1217274 RepID=UPI003FD809C1
MAYDVQDNSVNAYQQALACDLGSVTQILFDTERRAFRIYALAAQIWPAIRLRQIQIILNERGVPVGYAVWAFLTQKTAQAMVLRDNFLPHLSEWNEGDQLWLIDVVAPYGHLKALVKTLRNQTFSRFSHVNAVKRHKDGRVKAVVRLAVRGC